MNHYAITLPPGWTAEPLPGGEGRFLTVCHPTREGFATIDFTMRVCRLGWSSYGPRIGPRTRIRPAGRGWQQKLANEAVSAVKEAIQ